MNPEESRKKKVKEDKKGEKAAPSTIGGNEEYEKEK